MQKDRLVTQPAQLAELCRVLATAPLIAMDIEFIPENTYEPVLCLIQIAADDRIAAIDPLALGDVGALWSAIARPGIELVVHAGREELRFCQSNAGGVPHDVFDLQIAAGLVGLGYPLSHTDLVRRLLGVTLRRPQTRTDWRRRPLSSRQIDYAVDDVRFLLPMRQRLVELLEQMNRRDWLIEETQTAVGNYLSGPGEERWRGVPGTGRLSQRELAILRELYLWREQKAQAINRPAIRVLANHLLIELARAQPESMRDMLGLRGIERGVRDAWRDELLAAVRRGLDLPSANCPRRLASQKDSPQDEMVFKILAAALIELGRSQNIAPTLLGSKDDLKNLLEWREAGRLPDNTPRLASGWRSAVCGQFLVDLLEGRTHIRIQSDSAGPRLVFEAPTH